MTMANHTMTNLAVLVATMKSVLSELMRSEERERRRGWEE